MNPQNVILTGIPRAGTTLTCYLLNKLPNTVALHEPMSAADWGEDLTQEAICNQINQFFYTSRYSLLTAGTAISKQVDGQVPDNPKGDYAWLYGRLPNRFRGYKIWGRIGLRKSRVARGTIKVDKPLNDNFLLCIKHNGHFTTLLAPLRQHHYRCYAVIRHPLSILASWNTINFGPYDGHMHAAERIDPELAQKLDTIPDRFERQIELLSWFFESYQLYLPPENIIRYEEIVASQGSTLQCITPCAQSLQEILTNKNTNQLYNQNLMSTLAEKLLRSHGAFWLYYPKESVKQLLYSY